MKKVHEYTGRKGVETMSNSISRRNFLRTAGIGTLGATAAGLLAGCNKAAPSSVASAAGTYKPGTYTATATGINTNTPVTVKMTFSADAITDVQIDVAGETAGYGADIGDEMVKKILDAQSSEVDGHSGATITSGAIKKAAESCINQAKGTAVEGTTANKAETVVPDGLTTEEVESSCAELGDITPDETVDYDIVVVGAGAAGVPAAGWAAELGAKVALLQKQNIVVSQGNCGSAIIQSKSTEAGKKMWVHMTNGLCDWRANTDLLNAYVEHSEEALMWYLNRAGLTAETEYGDGSLVDSNAAPADLLHNDAAEIFAYMCTSQDLTGVWKDRMDTYDFGKEHCYFFAPWIGPKPKNVGDVLTVVLDTVRKKNPNLEVFFSTPAVKVVKDGDKVTGVIAKDESGKYIQFNAAKGVILATGDYMNNDAMVRHWCPDVDGYDKKQFQKTGDGHVMAIGAGAKMENLGHTKMMHDFDSGLMYEEPFLYVNMEGNRFCNEDTGFVYMGNVTKYLPRFNGANVDKNHPDGSLGWYCQIYDSDYMGYANSPVPDAVMTKYIPGAVENPQGVFQNLIDTYKADTVEELAGLLGIPADALQKTIDRYNELCETGTDVDFGKKKEYMHKIAKAPFWGIRKHIRVSSLDSGVNTNANGQALDADGKVIDGLYCVGNLGGVFYGGADYPFHQTGLSLGRCYTFGMIAAKHAMGKL
jgi:fumarate reductase flavoprotein subunit